MKKRDLLFIGTVAGLTALACGLSLIQAILLWNRDGHPAAFIIWIMGWGFLAYAITRIKHRLSQGDVCNTAETSNQK